VLIQVTPILDESVRRLCRRPYPGHPHGCPNWGRKLGCPPDARLFGQAFDISQPVYAVVNEFNLGAHVERMRLKHPGWSQRQLVCCLYWQAGARRDLQGKIMEAFLELKRKGLLNYKAVSCPEAMGVNVTETLQAVGIELEWPPVRIARQVALLGKPRQW
jgi:predicted metal-binding protein